MFFRILRLILEVEESIEMLKAKLCRRPKFNAKEAFKYLDYYEIGKLSAESFKKIF